MRPPSQRIRSSSPRKRTQRRNELQKLFPLLKPRRSMEGLRALVYTRWYVLRKCVTRLRLRHELPKSLVPFSLTSDCSLTPAVDCRGAVALGAAFLYAMTPGSAPQARPLCHSLSVVISHVTRGAPVCDDRPICCYQGTGFVDFVKDKKVKGQTRKARITTFAHRQRAAAWSAEQSCAICDRSCCQKRQLARLSENYPTAVVAGCCQEGQGRKRGDEHQQFLQGQGCAQEACRHGP